MPWHVTDFHEVEFNQDDNGWLTVYGIHRAIRERAEATQHSLIDDYDSEFALPLYLGEPDGDEDRVYLKDVLQQFYTDIDRLVDGDTAIRWTEESGAGTLWTMESLTTDIGLGEFSELLTRAANPEPFVWLQEALNRLIHPRVTTMHTTDVLGSYVHTRSDEEVDLQTAWDSRADISLTLAEPAPFYLYWLVQVGNPNWNRRVTVLTSQTGREYKIPPYKGELIEAYYNYIANIPPQLSLPSIEFLVGTSTITVSSSGPGSALTTDFALGSDTYIDAYIVPAPSTVPFDEVISIAGTIASLWIFTVDLHIDIAGELSDQI